MHAFTLQQIIIESTVMLYVWMWRSKDWIKWKERAHRISAYDAKIDKPNGAKKYFLRKQMIIIELK